MEAHSSTLLTAERKEQIRRKSDATRFRNLKARSAAAENLSRRELDLMQGLETAVWRRKYLKRPTSHT